MNNLWALMKVDLRETLDFRKIKENKGKSLSFLTFLLIMLIGGVVLSVFYNISMTIVFEAGKADLIYSTLFMAGITSALIFSTSVFKVKSIFMGKDYEMLRSMPIKKSTIISAKLINLYLVELLYSAIVLLPNTIIVILFSKNFIYLPIGILITVFVPAIPMLIAGLFSLFITLVADRYKFGNIINFILYTALILLVMFFSFYINFNGNQTNEEVFDASGYVSMAVAFAWINPSLQFIRLAFVSNYSWIFLFVGVNIVFFVLVVAVIAFLFDKVYIIINSFHSNTVYVKKDLESTNPSRALLKNEFKRFFSSKYYFINSLMSGICAIGMAGFISWLFSKYSTIEDIEEILPYIKQYAYIGAAIITFAIGICTPASCSISIEGNHFWLIKSFPIDYKKWIQAKLAVSISVLGVCCVIASTLVCIFIQPTILSVIALYVIPLLFVVLSSILGIIINLSYYKLKWKNEQECVKASAGMVLSMLTDWLIMIGLTGILVGFGFINAYLACGLAIVLLIVANVGLYFYLMSSAERKIAKIEEF